MRHPRPLAAGVGLNELPPLRFAARTTSPPEGGEEPKPPRLRRFRTWVPRPLGERCRAKRGGEGEYIAANLPLPRQHDAGVRPEGYPGAVVPGQLLGGGAPAVDGTRADDAAVGQAHMVDRHVAEIGDVPDL